MKISITIRQLLLLVLFIVIAVLLVSISVQVLVTNAEAGTEWLNTAITAFGNVIGGITGGIVAVIVATYQINHAIESNRAKELEVSNSVLRLVREELQDNLDLISKSIPFASPYASVLRMQLSDDTWKSTILYVKVPDSLLVPLHVSYKQIQLIKNILPQEKEGMNPTEINDLLQRIKLQVETTINLINDYKGLGTSK